jgi:hypothetical protein
MPKKQAPHLRQVRLIFKRSGLFEAVGLEFRVSRLVPWHQEGKQGHDIPWYFPNRAQLRLCPKLSQS